MTWRLTWVVRWWPVLETTDCVCTQVCSSLRCDHRFLVVSIPPPTSGEESSGAGSWSLYHVPLQHWIHSTNTDYTASTWLWSASSASSLILHHSCSSSTNLHLHDIQDSLVCYVFKSGVSERAIKVLWSASFYISAINSYRDHLHLLRPKLRTNKRLDESWIS